MTAGIVAAHGVLGGTSGYRDWEAGVVPSDVTSEGYNVARVSAIADPTTGTTKSLLPGSNNNTTGAKSSGLSIPFTCGAGTVTVRYQVQSETNYDWGYIYLDGVQKVRESGTSGGWKTLTLPGVSAGAHILRVVFTNDVNGVAGFNSIAIGRITWQ